MTTAIKPDILHEGDILQSSWGYDMTIIEYYEVVKVSKSGRTVTVRELRTRTTPADKDSYNELVSPVLAGDDRFKPHTVELRRRVMPDGDHPYVKISQSEYAYLVAGVDLLDPGMQCTWD